MREHVRLHAVHEFVSRYGDLGAGIGVVAEFVADKLSFGKVV